MHEAQAPPHHLWLDATYVKARRDGRIVPVAVAVNTDGRREVLGMATGNSEAEPFWTEFLRALARRGLRGVKLVIPRKSSGFRWDAHEGLKAAASRVLGATSQRCKVHFQRNALAHAGKAQRRIVAASRKPLRGFAGIGTAFAEADQEAAHRQRRAVADQLRPRVPKPADLMDKAEHDVLAFMGFPAQHRAKISSTNPLGRVNGEIKRRSDVVGTSRKREAFAAGPNEAAITRLVGALLLEQDDEWAVQRRYMPLGTMAPIGGAASARLPATAA